MNWLMRCFMFIPSVKRRYERWRKIETLLRKIAALQQELNENAVMFKAIFCINPVAMLLVGLDDGVIKDANNAFLEESGYRREDILEKNVLDINLYDDPRQRVRVVSKIITEGYIRSEPVVFRDARGVKRNCLLSSKVIVRKGKKTLLSVVEGCDEQPED